MISLAFIVGAVLTIIGILILVHTLAAALWLGILLLVVGLLILFGGVDGRRRGATWW